MSDKHPWMRDPEKWEVPMTPQLTSKDYTDAEKNYIALLVENDRLREALQIARDTISPHDYPALFSKLNAALAKETGQ
jgi:hypothetical protein